MSLSVVPNVIPYSVCIFHHILSEMLNIHVAGKIDYRQTQFHEINEIAAMQQISKQHCQNLFPFTLQTNLKGWAVLDQISLAATQSKGNGMVTVFFSFNGKTTLFVFLSCSFFFFFSSQIGIM